MGNQGMTNWKFSAFFAIALMLIAGSVHQHRYRIRRRRNGHGKLGD